ncbi:DUF1559 family PulG-like putative transporter [Frigoriglobus tundricola]|uniref:DUF1559 domain-containing protein n=1 Tax=Frigoriglobus tundricola TaxID=2774151 RepID=A0A6M5YSN6_9BACT|nr:DUF1559 domain-containing protein [Frigoriglobus tundricola]QJW97065.1 hypothetical protein FTUN_4629 [Frigoriglobus tundricola]
MARRSLRHLLIPFACLVVLAGLFSKPAEGDDPKPQAPAAVSSDYVLFARLNTKEIREGALFTDLKRALAKEGVTKLWDKMEAQEARKLGFKATDLDSVTICVTEISPRELPRFVLILTSSQPFDKTATFRLGEVEAKPDADGFYTLNDWRVHFPDDKTVVLLHPDLTQKYLDGYAKNRSAWPFTADLTKAAAGHTAFAVLNVQKLPLQEVPEGEIADVKPLLATRTVTLTADLKGKDLSVAARATYPDAAAAGRAKETVQKLVGTVAGEVETYAKLDIDRSGNWIAVDAFKPVFKGVHRAVKAAQVEVAGTDVTLTGGYTADFDVAKLVADGIKQVREVAQGLVEKNNLKVIALSMHNYASAYDDKIPVHGIGPKGALLKDATEKPLLSWRVAILPFIEQVALYNEFKLDEAWDSAHNKKLIEKLPKVFAPVTKPGKAGYTHLQMVIGPTAMQPPFADFKSSFPDGTSNTIMIVEAADPVIWTKPDDVMFPAKELPKDFRKKFGGQFPGGFHVAMWDGSVRFVSDQVTDRTLGHALTPAGVEVLGADWDEK